MVVDVTHYQQKLVISKNVSNMKKYNSSIFPNIFFGKQVLLWP